MNASLISRVSNAITNTSLRHFSTTTPASSIALDKFKGVLREYRLENYDHSFPKHYVNEFVKGIDRDHDTMLQKDDFSIFLNMIGASYKLSSLELDQAMKEILQTIDAPKDSPSIPTDKMQGIILDGIRRGEM